MRRGRLTVNTLRETAEHLDNPERGFYTIRSYTLTDETDGEGALADSFRWDEGETLTLAEFNLCRYREGAISAAGLDRLDALLRGLCARGKHLIVRFVYDLDGKNMQTEPLCRAVVERHMEQTGAVVRRYADRIFTLQGMFTGNWGEMNGSRYTAAEDLRALARQLAAATGGEMYLAVRMPAQWRQIVGEGAARSDGLAARLGLFDDGMLGSDSDLGTFGAQPRGEAGYGNAWRREDELAFEEALCARVPMGGEVVGGSALSDFPQAAEALRRMRVSYLNRDYDRAVLDKWAAEQFRGNGVWKGCDGLRYLEAHLGYRFVLEQPRLRRSFSGERLRGEAHIKNVGFAPVYHPLRTELVLADGAGRQRCIPLEGDLRCLAGGAAERPLRLAWDVPLTDAETAGCRVYVRVRSEKYGCEIQLGNTGAEPGYGYCIGGIDGK